MAEEVYEEKRNKQLKMPRPNRQLSTDDIGILFFIAAFLFGAWFRIYIPDTAGFPINDGGLFYEMIKGVQVSNYHLPEIIQYNGLDIPFAYPPLAFYVAGVVSDLFNITLIETIRWIPAVILIAIIPAIYYLALLILNSRFKAGLAALIYALLPTSVTWLIMGGGITRSLGQFFLLLTISCIFLMYNKQQRKYLILSIFFGCLVFLTHPEATIHTVGIALLMWFFYGRNKDGVINSLLVPTCILILTSPWWITILLRFGFKPYLSAMQTGGHGFQFLSVLLIPFSGEQFLTIIAVLAALGIATRIAKKEYFIPIWLMLPFLVEPRNAANVSIIPLAFLASIALTELIFPALSAMESEITERRFDKSLQSISEKFLLSYLLVCLLISMQIYSLTFSGQHVSTDVRESFEWIRGQTLIGSRFLVLTGINDVFADSTNEWFPVLTNRVSLTTIQGYEWIAGNRFLDRIDLIQSLQQCEGTPMALACIEDIATEGGLRYNYIFVAQKASRTLWGENLISELKNSRQHQLVYENDELLIFELLE